MNRYPQRFPKELMKDDGNDDDDNNIILLLLVVKNNIKCIESQSEFLYRQTRTYHWYRRSSQYQEREMRRAGERNLVHVAAYECRAFDIHFTCDIRSGFYDRGKSCCSGGLPKVFSIYLLFYVIRWAQLFQLVQSAAKT